MYSSILCKCFTICVIFDVHLYICFFLAVLLPRADYDKVSNNYIRVCHTCSILVYLYQWGAGVSSLSVYELWFIVNLLINILIAWHLYSAVSNSSHSYQGECSCLFIWLLLKLF